jgi:phytoene dehydrogenase-like protein
MKVIVVGAGLSGLTAAVTLAKAGHSVDVFEQVDHPGGVTAGFEDQGFHWDLGQLMVEGFGKNEPVGEILSELGVLEQLQISVEDRGYVFPDFAIRKPETFQGMRWRIDQLQQLFPDEKHGLEQYWHDYVRFTRLMTLVRRMERSKGAVALAAKAAFYLSLLPLLSKKDWSAEKLMAHYFKSEKLKGVFISILADFFTPPSQFLGLGIFAINPETVYDKRMPAHLATNADQIRQYYLQGGMQTCIRALVAQLQAFGGSLHTGCVVKQIIIQNERAAGIVDEKGQQHVSDVVIASGGAQETFCSLVGERNLPQDFVEKVRSTPLMDSIFMIHLGVDYDPSPYLSGIATYFYGSYDVEGEIQRARQGIYHEGAGGFVVHFPTFVSPSMAPSGRHALTIYTICPDCLSEGNWSELKEGYASKLLDYAEQHLPGLRQHILVQRILTPQDFRAITHLNHHAFGGAAPVMGAWRPPHQTPIEGLWFIGAQSESGGGVGGVIPAAYKVARKLAV